MSPGIVKTSGIEICRGDLVKAISTQEWIAISGRRWRNDMSFCAIAEDLVLRRNPIHDGSAALAELPDALIQHRSGGFKGVLLTVDIGFVFVWLFSVTISQPACSREKANFASIFVKSLRRVCEVRADLSST